MKCIRTIMIVCILLSFCGCNVTPNHQYQRITLSSTELGGDIESMRLVQNANVLNGAQEKIPSQLPIYQISERSITDMEINTITRQFDKVYSENATKMRIDRLADNGICATRIQANSNAGLDFSMSDEALEELAWEVLEMIPILKEEYMYKGIIGELATFRDDGKHVTEVQVGFVPIRDGYQVIPADVVTLSFDAIGLKSFSFFMYDYKKIGTMDLVPLKEAVARVKSPDLLVLDPFSTGVKTGDIKTLKIEEIRIHYYNQYFDGCTILQPVYSFVGVATDENNQTVEFQSKIIAIPESYTYENGESKN